MVIINLNKVQENPFKYWLLSDIKIEKVAKYSSFGYIKETNNAVYVTQENCNNTRVSFERALKGIEGYKSNPGLYQRGPAVLRNFGITHVNSPVWTLLHILKENDYKQAKAIKMANRRN